MFNKIMYKLLLPFAFFSFAAAIFSFIDGRLLLGFLNLFFYIYNISAYSYFIQNDTLKRLIK